MFFATVCFRNTLIRNEKVATFEIFMHCDIISLYSELLLLLLSRFSRVRLCATPQMAAHQVLPSLAFSRQEYWSGLPFSSPMHESEK